MASDANIEGERIAFRAQDVWDVIEIIAHMVSKNPLSAVKELVDNALDSFASGPFAPTKDKVVSIIIKKKVRLNPYIKVTDNGAGWEPHKDPNDPKFGRPDFEYTVENIGNSIKKKYAAYCKARDEGSSVGQFAIGLFSFWALGERLTVYSRSLLEDGKTGPCSSMIWYKETKEATIKHDVDPPPELAAGAGSVIVVDRLQRAQMNLVTGNALEKHLSRACRTVLMKSGASILIDDHGIRIPVKPKKYDGTLFPERECITEGGFGGITLQIYAFPPVESSDEFRVPIFCKGASVYEDITQIPELNIYPWNAKKVYGTVNYPFARVNPSRAGFESDNFLNAFIVTMQGVTERLSKFVDDIESRKKARQRDQFHSIFREKWEEIFRILPEEWQKQIPEGIPPPPPPPPQPITPGPMYRVEISPKEATVACRTVQTFTARPYDMNGNILRDTSLIFYWQVGGKPLGLLKDEMKKTCLFQVGGQTGIATLTVTVLQYLVDAGREQTIKKIGATNLYVVTELPPTPPPPPPKGYRPPTHEEKNLGEDGPHSQYETGTSIIYINDHHSDFVKAEVSTREKGDATVYRYINYCYAKEIAVDRWKTLDPKELSEKIIDLVALSEREMPWEELIRKPKGRPPREAEAAWESRALA